jgi:hypothetical protein
MTATARTSRRAFTLWDAWREFWKHPSPWLIAPPLVAAAAARVVVGDWQFIEAIVPVVMIAGFPFVEWVIHVFVLHWRPRRIGGLLVDSQVARKHREHHINPRRFELIFIPWQSLLLVVTTSAAIGLLAFPRLGAGLTFLSFAMVLTFGYEWCHYLIHSDYKPKSRVYHAVWQHHRLHHFKNERYWFTVTSSGTADRVLRTSPDPATVATSPTAKNLHGGHAPIS